MSEFGTHTLYVLLIIATWTAALALVGIRRRSERLVFAAQRGLQATAAVSTVSLLALTSAFLQGDFSITYVQRYSDISMPLFYRLTAVWGGQEGSLLFWCWLLAIMSAWSVWANRETLREILPHVVAVLALVIIFFCLLLLVTANPFDTFLHAAPPSGAGLNPLLQNPYMITHPPALYVGYVGMTIPFAFALAALWAGARDNAWVRASRPWLLASWYFLSLGLALGMIWAYEELGWGGYWGWDPVENAGLFPWLTATALLHSSMVQERRGMLKIWNVVLAVVTFELTIFGTFLTRSGMVQSVHAFAKSSIGWYFLGFMGLVLLVSAALVVRRFRLLRRDPRGSGEPARLEAVLSREFTFVLANWVLLASALLVLILTIFPTISEHFFGSKITINAAAFNRWMVPPGLTLLILMGISPILRWRKTSTGDLIRQGLWPVVIAVLGGVTLRILGMEHTLALVTLSLCMLVFAQVTQDVVRSVRAKQRRDGGNPLSALTAVVSRNRRRYGGYVVHIGIVMMYLGFAGDAYKQEHELALKRGQQAAAGHYILRYDGMAAHSDVQKQMFTAKITVFDKQGQRLGVIRPARWFYFKHKSQPTSEVDIRRTFREDLFVVLGSYDMNQQFATFKAMINPLVNWIWIGFLVLSLGTVIALVPMRTLRAARRAGLL